MKSSFTRQKPLFTESTYADRCWSAARDGSPKPTLLFNTSTKSLFPLEILHDAITSTNCDIVLSFAIEDKFAEG